MPVYCLPEPDDDRRHRLHIRDSRVKVHEARAEYIPAVDDGIRDEELAATLQPIEQRPVERIEVVFNSRLSQTRSKVVRHVSKSRDAQCLRHALQLGGPTHRCGQRP